MHQDPTPLKEICCVVWISGLSTPVGPARASVDGAVDINSLASLWSSSRSNIKTTIDTAITKRAIHQDGNRTFGNMDTGAPKAPLPKRRCWYICWFTTTLTPDSRMPSANSSSLLSKCLLEFWAATQLVWTANQHQPQLPQTIHLKKRGWEHGGVSCVRCLALVHSHPLSLRVRRRCSSIFQFSSAQHVTSLLASSRDFLSDGVTRREYMDFR